MMRLRGVRGQTSTEYMGALLLVALIIAALVTVVPQIGAGCPSTSTPSPAAGRDDPVGDDRRPGTTADPTADDDGDGLTNEEEAALAPIPARRTPTATASPTPTSSRTAPIPCRASTAHRGQRLQAVGADRDQRGRVEVLEEAILDEINPGGWKGFLLGDAAESLILDENGELVLVPPGAMVGTRTGS